MAELDDVLEAAAGHLQRALDVEERLLRLGAEITGRADDLIVDVAALLAGNVEDAARPNRLDGVMKAWIVEAGRRTEKAQIPRRPLRQRLSCRTTKGGNDGGTGDETTAGEVVAGSYCCLWRRIRLGRHFGTPSFHAEAR